MICALALCKGIMEETKTKALAFGEMRTEEEQASSWEHEE